MKKKITSFVLNCIAKSGRYDTFVVRDEQDRQACLDVLEEVRRKELNRVHGSSVLNSKSISTAVLPYELVACRDTRTNQIVGCMSIINVEDIADNPNSFREYQIGLFEPDEYQQLNVFTRLSILKSHRKTSVSLWIMIKGFLHTLSTGGKAVLMSCEPHLYQMYTKLGLQPLGGLLSNETGGYRIPMICMADKEHFARVDCPALPYLKSIDWKKYASVVSWYRALQDQYNIHLSPRISYNQSQHPGYQCPVSQGLRPSAKKQISKNALTLHCSKDDLIIAQNDGATYFGSIVKGFARIVIDNRTVGYLRQGEMFGELSFILESYRPYSIVAGNKNTQILLYSISALNRLKDAKDKAIVWQNFAKSVSQKLVKSNNLFSQADPIEIDGWEEKVVETIPTSAHEEILNGALNYSFSNLLPPVKDARLLYSGR